MAELGVLRRSTSDPRGNKDDAVQASKQKLFSLRMVYNTSQSTKEQPTSAGLRAELFSHQLRERVVALHEETYFYASENPNQKSLCEIVLFPHPRQVPVSKVCACIHTYAYTALSQNRF